MTNLCLAVECATARGSVALVDEHGVRAVRDWDVPERHAESVLPAIEAVLDEAGVRFDQVAVMGVDVGPGSFTGVRVALATVKGLAFAHRIPVVGVNSLEVLAVGAAAGDADRACTVLTALDAFKGEVFAALYAVRGVDVRTVLAPFHADPASARERLEATASSEPILLAGDAPARWPDAFEGLSELGAPLFRSPTAAALGAIALGRWPVRGADDLLTLAPFYLRGADAVLPASPLRVSDEPPR